MFFVVHDADGTIGLINSDYITSIDFKKDSTDIYTTDDMCYECSDPPSYFEFLCHPDFHHMLKDKNTDESETPTDDFANTEPWTPFFNSENENENEIRNSAERARSLWSAHK